jgi:hypothetical protein
MEDSRINLILRDINDPAPGRGGANPFGRVILASVR